MHWIVGSISVAGVLSVLLFGFRWYLLKTDISVNYNWKWQGTQFWPSFDIRNRSNSRTYFLANVAYTRSEGNEVLWFDNTSLGNRELKPGTITHLETAPVPHINSMQDCLGVEVRIRSQNSREFKGQGPGQLRTGFYKIAHVLREKLERHSIPTP